MRREDLTVVPRTMRPAAFRLAATSRAALAVAEAWLALAVVHAVTTRAGRDRLRRLFARPITRPRAARSVREAVLAGTWHAVDRARRVYPARVACLQSAAANVYLLRRRGVAAQLVIGVRNTPFEAHAWVELDGAVVGTDHDAMAATAYTVLDRL